MYKHALLFCRNLAILALGLTLGLATATAASPKTDWATTNVPGMWESAFSQELGSYNGFAWYRCFVKVPDDWAGQKLTLKLPGVDDADETFVNGTKVGTTGQMPPNYVGASGKPRVYPIDAKLVRPGAYNLIAVRVYDAGGSGGFAGGDVSLACSKGEIDLTGRWQFRTGDEMAWAQWPAAPGSQPMQKLLAQLSHNGLFVAPTIVGTTTPPDAPLTLWYKQPAANWNEALPVGNGSLGAMVFGGVAKERIQLNVDTLWAGGPKDRINPKALEALPKVRQLLFEGKNAEATRLAGETMMGIPCRIESYETLGDLWLEFPHVEQVTEYRRKLNLEEAMTAVTYEIDGVKFTRTVHACPVNNILVVYMKARNDQQQPADAISFTASLTREQDAEVVGLAPDMLILRGAVNGGQGMKYEARLQAGGNGQIAVEGNRLVVRNASDIVLRLAAATSYRHDDPSKVCEQRLAKSQKGFDQLKSDYLPTHRELFDRVKLELHGTDAEVDAAAHKLPTDERLARVKAGADDPALAALYFQFGRYLLISSSRPGCMPANLQGIWNDRMKAPWNADFHTNINLQMNYWLAENCNLAECHEPLFDLMDSIVDSGNKTAKAHYGCDGWVVHHLTDPFGFTVPADGVWGVWPVGAAWLAQHPYEHYLFSGDKTFLRQRAYPLMKGAARFMLDFLVEAPEGTPVAGKLVTCPSHSPENRFRKADGQVSMFTYAATMDLEIIHDLFTNCIDSIDVLAKDAADGKFDTEFRAELVDALKRLPPLQISPRTGALQEWVEDYDEPEPKHRHVSHMFGLHPGRQITLRGTPELAEAIRTTLNRRGDAATGWSRAWKTCAWARLEDGDRAYKIFKGLLQHGTLPNLFDTHPPFQIDGNFGATSAIAEMLLQSHLGNPQEGFELAFLPALPNAWPTGKVAGLRGRGGVEVDLQWRDGRAERAIVRATTNGRHKLRAPKGQVIDGPETIELKTGETYEVKFK